MNATENLPQVNAYSSFMPSQQEFQMLQIIAKNAQDSGLYANVGNQQAKIFMVILAARELGVAPMLALNGGIWNIQGKIEISAGLMNGLIRRAGHSIHIIRSDNEICILKGKRSDGDSFEVTFSIEEAKQAGLIRKNRDGSDGIWMKYPSDMLYNRCMSRLARRLFSDVIGTAYVEGEIKEAKEIEKLEQAECEEINHSVPMLNKENKVDLITNDTNLTKEPPLSHDQLTELMSHYPKTNDAFKENFEKYMFDKWGAKAFKDIPEKAYHACMTAIARNIEMQSTPELLKRDG